jgi:hypothetical protein
MAQQLRIISKHRSFVKWFLQKPETEIPHVTQTVSLRPHKTAETLDKLTVCLTENRQEGCRRPLYTTPFGQPP